MERVGLNVIIEEQDENDSNLAYQSKSKEDSVKDSQQSQEESKHRSSIPQEPHKLLKH
jgi:hypothetical protein